MSSCLFKLRFLTPVHIGTGESARSLDTGLMTFCADTLFSALCHATLQGEGGDEQGIRRLYDMARGERVSFSDAMPYKGEQLYLPKPYLCATRRAAYASSENGKQIKRMRYLPVARFRKYVAALTGGGSFQPQDGEQNFGLSHVVEKVAMRQGDQPEPYSVGLFTFHEGCGLYFLMRYADEETLTYVRKLLTLLGYSGIGGKVSTGYGKFVVEAECNLDTPADEQMTALRDMLGQEGRAMTLTTALPRDDEMDAVMRGSTYGLARRGGFVQSAAYGSPAKKQTQYFFAAGSVFEHRFSGDVYCVAPPGPKSHPVYRYAKPIFMGVST